MKSKLATLILRVPPSLHRRLKEEAHGAGLSLNRHCSNLLGRRASISSREEASNAITLASCQGRLQDLTAQVTETLGDKIDGLALFGSFARGRSTASSDIDLLIVLGRNMALDRDIYSNWKTRSFEGREVAPIFVQIPEEGERIGGLWFEVALDGILLYDKDLRLSRFLSHVRDLIAGGRVRRLITHGHPYWVYSDERSRAFPTKETHEKPRSRKRLPAAGQREA